MLAALTAPLVFASRAWARAGEQMQPLRSEFSERFGVEPRAGRIAAILALGSTIAALAVVIADDGGDGGSTATVVQAKTGVATGDAARLYEPPGADASEAAEGSGPEADRGDDAGLLAAGGQGRGAPAAGESCRRRLHRILHIDFGRHGR